MISWPLLTTLLPSPPFIHTPRDRHFGTGLWCDIIHQTIHLTIHQTIHLTIHWSLSNRQSCGVAWRGVAWCGVAWRGADALADGQARLRHASPRPLTPAGACAPAPARALARAPAPRPGPCPSAGAGAVLERVACGATACGATDRITL